MGVYKIEFLCLENPVERAWEGLAYRGILAHEAEGEIRAELNKKGRQDIDTVFQVTGQDQMPDQDTLCSDGVVAGTAVEETLLPYHFAEGPQGHLGVVFCPR
jgi:hypothetical protein